MGFNDDFPETCVYCSESLKRSDSGNLWLDQGASPVCSSRRPEEKHTPVSDGRR